VPSPDGTKLIVGAERDGDTVSPPRGVYVIDLSSRVSKADIVARLRANLQSETDLKAAGVRAFQPIAAEVRAAVARASVDRVFGYEKSLFDFDSKHISQPGNRRAAEFLVNTYKSFGYEAGYQWFDRANAYEGKTANVVATLRGTMNPELVYVISSHFDSVEAGPGADDDTSGTAALLEAARVLAGHPLPATVMFASMTGEEAGLLGSREFVRRAVEQKLHIAAVLNNDMIGWMNDQRMDNTIRYSNPGIRDIQHAAAMQFSKLITYDALYWKGTDAMSFYDVYGDVIGGIGSYPVLGSPYYHQSTDLLENEDHQLITETSKTTIATIMLLASSPARLTKLTIDSYSGSTAEVSWAPAPEKGVTSYIVAFGPSGAPRQRRIVVTAPHVTLPHVPPGTNVSVKAVNARGLQGWDWASVTLSDVRKPVTTPQ
jgi:Peptidase family M28